MSNSTLRSSQVSFEMSAKTIETLQLPSHGLLLSVQAQDHEISEENEDGVAHFAVDIVYSYKMYVSIKPLTTYCISLSLDALPLV